MGKDTKKSEDGAWREALRADLEHLLGTHRPRVYRMCLRICGDAELAEELTQDTLLTAVNKLDSFDGRSSFSTWLCGIAKMRSLNAVRKHRELLTEDGVIEAQDPSLEVLKQLRRQEREELMRQATLDLLDEVEQEVVYLRYTELMPRARIAEMMELESVGEVRTILQRCSRRLETGIRKRLRQLGHGSSFVRTGW